MTRIGIGMALAVLGLAATAGADDKKAGGDRSPVGTWRQVAVVSDGKMVNIGPGALLRVTPEGFKVEVNGQLYMKGKTEVRGDSVPARSTIHIEEGAHAGAKVHQISKIEGDVMLSCQTPGDKAEPTSFTSEPGSGRTLSVWIRVEPATP